MRPNFYVAKIHPLGILGVNLQQCGTSRSTLKFAHQIVQKKEPKSTPEASFEFRLSTCDIQFFLFNWKKICKKKRLT